LHQRIGAEVKAQLEAKGKSTEGVETFEEFYGLLQSEAVMLQKKYQPQLRDGIKIAVDLVNSVKEDAKDGDVDVRVNIAPNNTEELVSVIKDESQSFELANGGLDNDGHKILTGRDGKGKEIHLISTHLDTTEAALIDELETWKQRFTDTRDFKIKELEHRKSIYSTKVTELKISDENISKKGKAKRLTIIDKQERKIVATEANIQSLKDIDEKNRDEVMVHLHKWSKTIGKMPTDKKTKFGNRKIMEKVIILVIDNNISTINKNFIDKLSGTSKPIGTTMGIRQTFSGSNLRVGYEFDASMNVVKMKQALSTVECRLIISDPFNFMVETAYLEPKKTEFKMSLVKEKEEYKLVLEFMKRFFNSSDDTAIYFVEALDFLSQNPSEEIQLAYAFRAIFRDRKGETIRNLLNSGTNRFIYDTEEAIDLLEWIIEELLIYDIIETYEELRGIKQQEPALEFIFTDFNVNNDNIKILKTEVINELCVIEEMVDSFFIRAKILFESKPKDKGELWFDLNKFTKGFFPCLYFVIQPTKEEQKGKISSYMQTKGFVKIPDKEKEFMTYL
jgi:hypothetical protein